MQLRSTFSTAVISVLLLTSAQAGTLEQTIARNFLRGYRQNEARLSAISRELNTLPQPYMREPTGTGGYLSREHTSADGEVLLTFSWNKPVELDAVALFPLRLFTDEIYDNNLYWPGSITIEAEIGGQPKIVAQCTDNQPLIRQSLPQLIEFDPLITRKLVIRCTDLPQHPHEKWHAAGFAEICIFSDSDNVAPRATLKSSSSRQGYYVLANEFLTDAQTPLGIPELSDGGITHNFIKKSDPVKKETFYTLTLIYDREITLDAVRMDPAIQHSYGQGFPVRFSIDLLDARNRVVQADHTYADFPLRNPGLNPHFSYFPETRARAVRLTVLESSQPVPKAVSTIAFSEITPLHQGSPQRRPAVIEEEFRGKKVRLAPGDPLDKARLMLASACDGLTHSGRQLPLRQWIEGLARRQQLLEEQMLRQNMQRKSLTHVATTLIHGSLTLLVFGTGSAIYFVARNRIRMRKEIRGARARIASDLHDDVGSNLGTIILHVEKLQEQTDTPPDQSRLQAIYRLTRESVFGLREVLSTTAPEVGRTQDIITYMHELAGLILGKTRYTFHTDPAMSEKLSESALRKGLLLFYKEALYNAKRHANCSQIDISLRVRDGHLILRIKDNGEGIDEATLKKARTLRTIKQRADWLQADLKIETAPGAGTELTLCVALT